MIQVLKQIQLATILLKGGPGSGRYPAGSGGENNSGSLTGDDWESRALRTRVIGEWSQKHGVTSSTVLAGISRGLKAGKNLNEAIDHAYRMANRGLTVPVYQRPDKK